MCLDFTGVKPLLRCYRFSGIIKGKCCFLCCSSLLCCTRCFLLQAYKCSISQNVGTELNMGVERKDGKNNIPDILTLYLFCGLFFFLLLLLPICSGWFRNLTKLQLSSGASAKINLERSWRRRLRKLMWMPIIMSRVKSQQEPVLPASLVITGQELWYFLKIQMQLA